MTGGLRLLLASACVPVIATGCGALRLHVVDANLPTPAALVASPRTQGAALGALGAEAMGAEAIVRRDSRATRSSDQAAQGPSLGAGADVQTVAAEDPAPAVAPEFAVGLPLDVEECRRLAVKRATPGRLINEEWCLAGAIADRYWCVDRHPSDVHQRLLMLRKEQRANELAGDAVQLLYRLQEAYDTAVLLEDSVREADHAIDNLKTFRERGLKSPAEPEELNRLRLGLMARRRALDDSIVQGQTQLRYLIGMEPVAGPLIRPIVDPPALGPPPDVDFAVALGVSRRAELRLIRLVLHELEPGTLPAARGVLQQFDPTLGTATGRNSTIGMLLSMLHHSDPELGTRCRQLTILLADRRRSVSGEIAQAVEAVATALARLELTRATVASREQQLNDVEQRRAGGETTAFDITQAKLNLLEARMQLVQDTAALQLAWTKLDRALGAMACGPLSHGEAAIAAPPPPVEGPLVETTGGSLGASEDPVRAVGPALASAAVHVPSRPMTLSDHSQRRPSPPRVGNARPGIGIGRAFRIHAID